uniref:Uncharacterized protein n=1 Tax=Aegilops tauschii subsp. strangulata TaxID=200361 RepID=A0A453C9R7_AEGTS
MISTSPDEVIHWGMLYIFAVRGLTFVLLELSLMFLKDARMYSRSDGQYYEDVSGFHEGITGNFGK